MSLKQRIAALTAELLGSFFLVLIILLAALLGGGIAAFPIGFGLAVLIYTFGKYSEGHFNPAVSLGANITAIANKTKSFVTGLVDFISYSLVQFLGALIAYPLVLWIRETLIEVQIARSAELGFPAVRADIESQFAALSTTFFEGTETISFFLEGMLTFLFVFTIISVVNNEKVRSAAGLIIGTSLFAITSLAAQITGASFHPFRSLIPAIYEKGVALEQVWLYIVAPLGGALVAALVYLFLDWLGKPSKGKAAKASAPKRKTTRRKKRK